MAVELLGAEPLLPMTGKDRLNGSVLPFNRLKRGERHLNPILREVIKGSMGLLADRHSADGSQATGSRMIK